MSPRAFWWPVAVAIIFTTGVVTGYLLRPPEKTAIASTPHAAPKAKMLPPAAALPKVPPVTPAPSQTPDSEILQLFLPEPDELAKMHQESNVDATIEHIIVMSYMLVNCGLMRDVEYEQTYSTLLRYLAQFPDEDSPEARASEAAKRAVASYGLIYRHADCNDASMKKIAKQLADWRKITGVSTKHDALRATGSKQRTKS